MKQPLTIGNMNFKSKKDAEIFVKNKITNIGIIENLKEHNYDDYLFFYNLFKRHLYAYDKLKKCKDIRIYNNFGGLALEIVNDDNTYTEISWRKCISQKDDTKETLFKKALRTTIKPQIDTFRNNCNTFVCELCDAKLDKFNTHIDHIIHFHTLVDNFCDEYDFGDIPSYYDKTSDYMRTFKDEDMFIGDAFYDYHLEHAKLRKLCKICNTKRPN